MKNLTRNTEEIYKLVSRYGTMLVSMESETERYLMYKYKTCWFDFTLELGEVTEVGQYYSEPKTLKALQADKHNKVRN